MAPKTPAGEMTAPELRKLIRAHNILSKIVIPKGTDREGLIKLIEGKNYKVDHKDKVIRPKQQRGKQITLKKAEELTKPKPVSEAVKKQRAEKKKEKEEEKQKDIKIAKKQAVQEFKKKKKEAGKLNKKKDLKIKSILINKKDMGETQFIKNQKKLQLEKQKETRRALLKQKVKVDKTTRRGKPVKKKEEELSTEEMKKKIKEIEEKVKKKEEELKKKSEKKEILKSEKKPAVKKQKPQPKDFKIVVRGREYNREGFLNWIDKEGYKISQGQLNKLNNLAVDYNLQSFRTYYNSNGVLVLVPTLKFNATDKETKLKLGLVVSEMAGQRGGAIFKLELKPKEKLELTPEKIKEYDMTRLKFLKEEIPSLEKAREEQLNILREMDKERSAIKKKEDNEDKKLYTSIVYGTPDDRYGYRQIEEDLQTKAKDWKTKKTPQGGQYYAPQGIRDWFEKNNIEAQRINSLIANFYKTITGLQNTEKKIKKKYDIK